MHGPFDKSPQGEPNIYRNWSLKLFALPFYLVIALIAYAVSHPQVAKWMSEAASKLNSSAPSVAGFCLAHTGRATRQPDSHRSGALKPVLSGKQIGAALDREFGVDQRARMVQVGLRHQQR